MTSNDNYVTVDMFNNGIQEIKAEMREMKQEIKDTRKDLMAEIRVNQSETRAVHDKVNMGFTLTTVFLGIIGGLVLIVPAIKALGEYFASKRKNYVTEEQVQNIVESAISKASAGISR